jgi:predicted CoA-substrate-specific enzyme activase
MGIIIGIDVGTVSIKSALILDKQLFTRYQKQLQKMSIDFNLNSSFIINEDRKFSLVLSRYKRIKGNPRQAVYELLNEIYTKIPSNDIEGIRVCGSGGSLISDLLGINYENEFRAIARGVGELYPDVKSIFEMGGQNAKFIEIEKDESTGNVGIVDYEKSGDCAAGTGSFLDQQALRLKYNVEDIGTIVGTTSKSAKIAGRCSVFAKSDMIHAQQKGFTPAEVLKGLCEAVARNFKSSIVKGKWIKKPVLFAGGVAKNQAVVNAMREIFQLAEQELIVPSQYAWFAAIGTALAEHESQKKVKPDNIQVLQSDNKSNPNDITSGKPLSKENVIILRNQIKSRQIIPSEKNIETFLGIDVGSVSTNLAVLDNDGRVVKEIYTRTEGRPIEIVDVCLQEIERELGKYIKIMGVGTTGSGRELIGELVGADTINDEITAHKTGAEFLARTMLQTEPDTIFEIGGQDSKYISLENGIVVDFAMNEACAAGTGSFLEERAEELGISIKKEFAELALSSKAPVRLGERCTVFMQQDVASHQQRGASKQDLAAGLAYSIVYNYLNRVVRGRKIGKAIFFQGGTAYNDAIASAFAKVLNQEIIVPPYNGVIGAVGAALLAREKMQTMRKPSKFRGFSLENVDYSLKEFTCKACSNFCHMQEFTVEGEKTYWGDQCSDKFRRRQSSEKKPVIEDLLAYRRHLLFQNYEPEVSGKATIGLPRGLYVYEQMPLWNTFFRELGFQIVLSDETNGRIIRQGTEASIAEPCLPIQAYHGHVQNLMEKNVDWIFIPNTINADTPFKQVNSYYCPWGQTVPFVIRSSPVFTALNNKLIIPSLRFRDGKESVSKSLMQALKPLGVKAKDIDRALQMGFENLHRFHNSLIRAGEIALGRLKETGEIGIVLVGRTYNINDRGMTLDIGNKLRDYYGVNVIPMDFLPVDSVDISDVNANMYWNYGRKILAAAKIVGQYPNLHIIYMTNFKCGPDSYIKHYITAASGKPFLTLQFDGHSNDAGYITRCEAYLDSKGALRWWKEPPADSPSRERKRTEITI